METRFKMHMKKHPKDDINYILTHFEDLEKELIAYAKKQTGDKS